jgi:hypothetical protein
MTPKAMISNVRQVNRAQTERSECIDVRLLFPAAKEVDRGPTAIPSDDERNRDFSPTIANVSTLPVAGRREILKQLNLQQKHEISGLHIWGSGTHISHPLDVSCGRICCICICRPHGQPSAGTQGRICNKGNALCLSSPCPPWRSVWRTNRTHSQGSRSGAGTVHTCLPSAPSRVDSVEV